MQIELIPQTQQTEAANRWQCLEEELNLQSALSSWKLIKTWSKYYGGQVPHSFAFGIENNETVGATLITQPYQAIFRGRVKLHVHRLHIGASGEPSKEGSPKLTDNQLLVSNQLRLPFATALMKTISDMEWDELLLQGMVPEDARALAIAGLHSKVPIRLKTVPYPVFNFQLAQGAGYPDVYSALRANKGRIRKNRAKFEKEFGQLSGTWAETIDEAHDIFNELVNLNRERWAMVGELGSFPTDKVIHFYRELIDQLFDQGQISLYRLRAGCITLGGLLSLLSKNKVILGYKSGINLSSPKIRRLAPGILTHAAYMQELLERGYGRYAFGFGGEPYKKDLGNAEDQVEFGFAYRGFKGRTMQIIRGISRRH